MIDRLLYQVNAYIVLSSSLFSLFLAWVVYRKNNKLPIHKVFFLFLAGVGYYQFIIFITLKSDKKAVLFLDRLIYVVVVFLPALLYQFGLYFTKSKKRKLLYLSYFLSAVFLATVPTKYFVDGVFVYKWGMHSKGQIVHNIFLIYLFSYIILFFVVISAFYKKSKGLEREQTRYILLAFTFLVVFATSAFVTAYNIPIYPFTYLGVLAFSLIITYAIIKHRLMDVRLVVIKSAVYTILIAFLTTGYVFFVFYLKNYYEKLINPDAVFIIASFAVALGFQPLKRFLQKYADKIFAKGQYNFEDLLKKLSDITSTTLHLTSLSRQITQTFLKELKIGGLYFFTKNYQDSKDLKIERKQTNKLLSLSSKDILVADELEDNSLVKKLMRKLKIEVLVFFPGPKNKPLGFLALSEKINGDAYTLRDLKLLEIIAPQISVALKNIEQQRKMIEKILEERQRINQDAHDHIYNRLGALSKKAEATLLSNGLSDEAKTTLKLLKDDLKQSVADLQKIVSGKSEECNQSISVLKELKRLCADFKAKSAVKLSCNFDSGFAESLEPNCFWHLQCILEECLNNIRKHSKATEAKVILQSNNGSLILQVIDNGVGLKKTKANLNKGHFGLKGMKARAAKIGAKLHIASNNGKGTKVKLIMPC